MKPIQSRAAPKAIGPYSQGVTADKLTFLSGQIPLNPTTGQMIEGDIGTQTEQVMKNLQAVLKAGGLDFKHVVRCTIYLMDLADFAMVNEVYGRYFTENFPARSTVQVAGLPKGARIEVDAIAVGP